MARYIHLNTNWTQFSWESDEFIQVLGEVRNLQGKLIGKLEVLGFDLMEEANLMTLTEDVIKTSEIEGEILDKDQVRSSIARRLGLDIVGSIPSDRNVDGVVEMMIDATKKAEEKLTEDRLFGWHSLLFPTGRSGMYKIQVAQYRNDENGAIQVVSGAMGHEKVHYEAPASERIEFEMNQFLEWFNNQLELDSVLKSAIAHFWFVTIHPFDDGNGRIARSIADLQLTRSDGINQRFYSMSSQIRKNRKEYYEILEKTQKGNSDITNWLNWYCHNLLSAIKDADKTVQKVMEKHQFWQNNKDVVFNERQIKILNKLLDYFDGNLTTSKWAKINKTSADTALRDITDLIQKNILKKMDSGGRSTNYELV